MDITSDDMSMDLEGDVMGGDTDTLPDVSDDSADTGSE
jgi:hypothetical protein